MLRTAVVTILGLAAALIVGCGEESSSFAPVPTVTVAPSPTPPSSITVLLRDLTITAETAASAEERGQGLSDRPSLGQDAGMLFFLSEPRIPGFHMRNMQFSLDFVWISAEGIIVDLTENVPHPAAVGETISGISPRDPVLFVLEVNAGVIDAAGLEIGDQVTFEPDILAYTPNVARSCDRPTTTATSSADGNRLQNGGLEGGPYPWCSLSSEVWGPPFAVSETTTFEGGRSALLQLRSEHGGDVRVYGVVQEIAANEFPEVLSAEYFVDHWEAGSPIQYLQAAVIVWEATNRPENLFGATNHQIRYILAGVDSQPTQISNARYLLGSQDAPKLGEWVHFERDVARDFGQLWGAVPEGFDRVRVLFEVRWDDRSPDAGPSAADVFYDELYFGTRE